MVRLCMRGEDVRGISILVECVRVSPCETVSEKGCERREEERGVVRRERAITLGKGEGLMVTKGNIYYQAT